MLHPKPTRISSKEEFLKEKQDQEYKVIEVGKISNTTRKGEYYKISKGISTSTYFLGVDESQNLILERVA